MKGNFNLETAIETWKSFFSYRRAFFSDDMEELELHLREDIAHLMAAGYSDEEAFREASSRIGNVTDLDDDFGSVYWNKVNHKNKLLETFRKQLSMFNNYLKTALRNLAKNRGYSALNITGLAVGLASAFFILLWMNTELEVDGFHANDNRLFQVKINVPEAAAVSTWSNVPAPLASTLESEFTEVESAILTLPIRASLGETDRRARADGFYVGNDFFEAFSFPLVSGSPESALDEKDSIVISERLADRIFGSQWHEESLIGEPLVVDYWQSNGGVLGNAVRMDMDREFVITGVVETIPGNSSMSFDFVLPVQGVMDQFPHLSTWGPRWFNLYLLSSDQTLESELSASIAPVLSAHTAESADQEVIVQPFSETYLYGSYSDGIPSGGLIDRVVLTGLVGLAILLIACINFTNLLTARSASRAREIGVRKTMGATPTFLVHQFLGESVLTALFALVAAIAMLAMGLPVFNTVTGLDIGFGDLGLATWSVFLMVTLLTGLVAGSYPAFVLSSLNVAGAFNGRNAGGKRSGHAVRHALVIVQFAVSIVLIVATLTMYRQIEFLKSKDLGIDKDHVVSVRIEGELGNQIEAARSLLEESSAIEHVSFASANPLEVAIKTGNVRWSGKAPDETIVFSVLGTDAAFSETMKLDLAEGRFFDAGRDAGQLNYVVNEEAVRVMNLDSPIGHPFALGNEVEGEGTGTGRIIGVVKNFHTGSLIDQQIEPVVMRLESTDVNFLFARLRPGRAGEGLAALQAMTDRFIPAYPFEYTFMDAAYEANYQSESMMALLSRFFAVIAIVIASLGLLGLSAHIVQQRTKEIGVRRVLGATKSGLIMRLSRDLVLLVLASLFIALPVAWMLMQWWLSSFAFRTTVGMGSLLLAATISLILAAATVGLQASRAAGRNPAILLRHD